MVIQQPQRGILGKVAWKCIFIVTDMKGWGFCLGKTNWHQLKDTAEMSLGRVYTWQLLQGFFSVFILAFLFFPPLFMFLLWWHNPTCLSRTAQQLLRIHCQLSPVVAWDWFLLNIPPFHWGTGGMGWQDSLVMSPRAVYCEQEVSQSVLLFVFRGQFIFNLTQRNSLLIISSYLVFLVSILGRNMEHWFGVS